MKNAVVVTGLPRLPDKFKKTASELYKLKKKNLVKKILFVTWKGELTENPQLERHLKKCGFKIIKRNESPVAGRGNIWHQMKALEIGLNNIPDDYYVLKTRSDVRIKKSFLKEIFNHNIKHLNKPAGSDVFKKRIWVPWFTIGSPFCIDDRCFFGLKEDLSKLVNYNAKYDVYDYDVIGLAHVRRYIEPYKQYYDFLDQRFDYYRQDQTKNNVYELYKRRVKSPVFGQILSFYYKVMLKDFYVYMEPIKFYQSSWEQGPPRPIHQRPLQYLEKNEFMTNFNKKSAHHIDTKWNNQYQVDIYCYNTQWLRAHFQDIDQEDIPSHIEKGIIKDFEEWRDTTIGEEELANDIKKEDPYWKMTKNYPNNIIANNMQKYVLSPLGIEKNVKYIYDIICQRT